MFFTRMIATLAILVSTPAWASVASGDYTLATAEAKEKLAAYSAPPSAARDITLAIQCHGRNFVLVPLSTAANSGYPVVVLRRNGINSDYEVATPGCMVLANRWLTASGRVIYYSGYSRPLNTGAMRLAGLRQLANDVADAASALRKLHVPSMAVPGESVADVVKSSLVEALLGDEHIDYSRLARPCARHKKCGAGESIGELFDEFLVVLAANQDLAYSLSDSKASAHGLAQFIESTYARVVAEYPAAHLEPDYAKGAGDHKTAIQAAFLLLDEGLATLPPALRTCRNGRVALYLAAYYNDGLKGARAYWRGKKEKAETTGYLAKLKPLLTMLDAGWTFPRQHARIAHHIRRQHRLRTLASIFDAFFFTLYCLHGSAVALPALSAAIV